MHVIGIVLVFLSLACLVKKEEGKKFNFGWLIAAIAGMVFCGSLGIIQKFFSIQTGGYKLNNFLCIAFIFSITISAILMLISKPKNVANANCLPLEPTVNQSQIERQDKKALIRKYSFIVVLGVIFGLVNITNTYLVGVLPSVVIFPVLNGGIILLTTIISALLFKEKISFLQKAGILIGILGILCITIGKMLV
jgi:drug/metabolite transporter (DMT)-like permease